MAAPFRPLCLLVLISVSLRASPPAALTSALEYLRDQKSYSWEAINADPGPVAQQFETRRGTITTVQQSTAPNLKGQIDRNGDMLIQREWSDGLRLDSIINDGLDDSQREMMGIATDGAKTLLGMINDLLDVEKMESGGTSLHYESVARPGEVRQPDWIRDWGLGLRIQVRD